MASHISDRTLGRRLPTAFINPQAPILIIGKESSSSPTKILKSGPNAESHSVTNPRSFTACFIPTKLFDLSFISFSVSSETLTAVLPGI